MDREIKYAVGVAEGDDRQTHSVSRSSSMDAEVASGEALVDTAVASGEALTSQAAASSSRKRPRLLLGCPAVENANEDMLQQPTARDCVEEDLVVESDAVIAEADPSSGHEQNEENVDVVNDNNRVAGESESSSVFAQRCVEQLGVEAARQQPLSDLTEAGTTLVRMIPRMIQHHRGRDGLLLRPEPQRGNYLSTNLPVEVVVPSGCDDGRRRPSQKEPVDLDADAHGSKSLQQVDRRKYACTKLFYAIRQEKTSEALELIRQCVEMDEREISMSNKLSISGAGLLMNHSSFDIPVGKGVTPLIMASQRGNVMVVKALLGHKTCLVHVNHFSSTGSTALIQASHFGHLEIVKYLLLHGANVEQANYKSTTALMRAAQEGHEHVVRILLRYGASVARKNLEKMSALMLASQRGHAQVVRMLICAGAEMDEKTAQDSTALMLACKRNHVQVAKVLVAAGCQLFLKDNLKRTARDTAQRKSFPELMELLTPTVQVQLMKRDVRRDRNHIMIQVWNLLQQERATVPFEDGCLSIHQVADMDNSRALLLVETTQTALIRTMTLPAPLVEHIAGFLPLPNLCWARRLEALTTTCSIDPDAAVICTLDLVDEILVEGGFIEALDSSGVQPLPTFQSWAQWKAWGTKWDGPYMKRILSMGTSSQNPKPGTERVGGEAGDDAGERATLRSAPYDERGGNGPVCRPKSTTMELRRAACFLQLLANSPPQLEQTLMKYPYNMPHSLLTKLAINRDMQSLVRRCIGVHFEVRVATDLVFLTRQLATWCTTSREPC